MALISHRKIEGGRELLAVGCINCKADNKACMVCVPGPGSRDDKCNAVTERDGMLGWDVGMIYTRIRIRIM